MKTIFRGVIEDGPFGGNGGGGWTDGGEVHLNGQPSALDVRYTWIWFYSWYQVYLDTLLLLISGKPGYTSTLDVRYTWKHFYPLISVIPGCNSTLDIMYTWIHFYPWYQAYLDALLLLISGIPEFKIRCSISFAELLTYFYLGRVQDWTLSVSGMEI